MIENMEEHAPAGSTFMLVSDLHLGWEQSNITAVERSVFRCAIRDRPDYLIINGDFIDLWRAEFHDIVEQFQYIFSYLRTIGEQGTKVRYILGNHDYEIRKYETFFADFENFIIIGNSLNLYIGDKKCLFLHGHQFDPKLKYLIWAYPTIGAIIRCVYRIKRWLQ